VACCGERHIGERDARRGVVGFRSRVVPSMRQRTRTPSIAPIAVYIAGVNSDPTS
jgi:hypothetical protein